MNDVMGNGANSANSANTASAARIPPDFPSVKLPPNLGNVQFTISTLRNRKDKYCKQTTLALQDFVDELSAPVVKPETHAQYLAMNKEDQTNSKDVGGYVLGTLKGNRRNKNTVEGLCGVALDADFAQATLIDTIRYTVPYLTIVYSTRKHTAEKPRYRIIMMLKHPVSPEQHSAISRKLAEKLGMQMFDKTTFEPNRMMFFPSISADGQYVFQVFGRELCDPDAVLAEYEDWRDSSKWPISPEETRLIAGNIGTRQKDPMAKEGIIGAYNRTHTITSILEEYGSALYEPSPVPNRWSFRGADSTAGAVVYGDKFFFSFHASDPLSYQLLNAFDLTRVLKFGDQDENARESTPTTKLPSYKAMLAFAREDGDVKEMLAEQKAEKAAAAFSVVGEGISGSTSTTTPSGPPTAIEDQTSKNSKRVTPDSSAEWKRKLEYDGMGELKGSMYNALLILNNDENLQDIMYNELTESIEINGQVPWSHPNEIWRDQDDSQLITYLELNYGSFSERIYKNALAKISDDRRYHPIKDYLNSLPPWDGVPRVDRLLVTTLGAADTPYVHAVTRKMLCAAIARIFVPGTKVDSMMVLVGPQGTGKSTLIARLAMKWFSDCLMLTDTKDRTAPEKILGYWINEISELAGLRKGDQETMKGFLSRQNDIFRPAYGRRSIPHLRQCIFIGTTNAEQGFLRDTTGNRRFWPVRVPGYADKLPDSVPAEAAVFHKHSWELTQADVDQIWAEAMVYSNMKEPLVLPPELAEEAQRTQRESMEADDREPLVREYLEKLLPENWDDLDVPIRINFLTGGEFAGQKLTGTVKRTKVSTMEIWTECFGNTSSKIGRADSNQIIAMLERIPGWVRSERKARVKPYGTLAVYVRDPNYVPEEEDLVNED